MTSTGIIYSFLTCTRNRLWSQAILDCLFYGVWWTSVIAVIGGFLHILFYPLTWMLYVTLLLTPLAVTLLIGLLFRKPPLSIAAATADNWFDGKSLMSAALDQLNDPEKISTRAGRFVIEQAAHTAAVGQKRLASHHKLVIPRQMLIPLSLTLIGFFLLMLPQQTNRTSEVKPVSSIKQVKLVPQNSASRNLVADLQQVLRTRITENKPHEVNDHAVKDVTSMPSSPDNRDTRTQGPSPVADNKTTVIAVANPDDIPPGANNGKTIELPQTDKTSYATQLDGKRSNAPGTSVNTKVITQAAAQTGQLYVEFFSIPIPQTADGAAGTGKGKKMSLQANDSKTDLSRVTRSARAAEHDISMPYEMSLTPAQKRYMGRYFQSLGETP